MAFALTGMPLRPGDAGARARRWQVFLPARPAYLILVASLPVAGGISLTLLELAVTTNKIWTLYGDDWNNRHLFQRRE